MAPAGVKDGNYNEKKKKYVSGIIQEKSYNIILIKD